MGCSDLDSIAKDNMQRLYANAFMLLGSKHDAEDAAEEAIYQLYRRKPEFESDEHARAWLIRVTVNAALSSSGGANSYLTTAKMSLMRQQWILISATARTS